MVDLLLNNSDDTYNTTMDSDTTCNDTMNNDTTYNIIMNNIYNTTKNTTIDNTTMKYIYI